jgi:hypothetical protein
MKKLFLFAVILCLVSLAAWGAATITSPNGGESWALGSSHDIRWTHSGDNISINIQLYQNGEWVGLIASGLNLTDDRCPWTVGRLEDGTSVAAGINFTIRIVRATPRVEQDSSDAAFTITSGSEPPPADPTLTLSSPNGGQSWELGSSHPITWSSSNLSGTVSLSLLHDGTELGPIGSANVSAGSFPWTVGNYTGGRGTVRSGYRIRVRHSSGTPSDDSNADFSIIAAGEDTEPPAGSGHDLVISDPYLENRSGNKGVRVRVTDLEGDFNGWVIISQYCMKMGLGNSEEDRRRLELRRGVPVWVNLRNLRTSLFDNECGLYFQFRVNPDHAVTESNYSNNLVTKTLFKNHHDGRFSSLRLGGNYTPACEACQVRINRGDVESVDGNQVRIRLEIFVQNCGSDAINNGSLRVLYNYRHHVGSGSRGRWMDGGGEIDRINDIDIPSGQWRIFNRTVTIDRYLSNTLSFEFDSGADDVSANNHFHCHLAWSGF